MLLILLISVPLIWLAWSQIGGGRDVWEEAAEKARKKREEKEAERKQSKDSKE